MKKKLILIIVGIIGFIVILMGITLIFLNPADKKEKLRKIDEEEISHETALEISEFYLEKNPVKEKIEIKKAKVLANNLNGEYLVRIELDNVIDEDSEITKDVILKYLGNGKWDIEISTVSESENEDRFTEFWPEDVELD